MRPRPFTILSAASLLLCLAAVSLWARSYTSADLLTDWWHRPHDEHFIVYWPIIRSESGRICFRLKTSHVSGPPNPYPSDRRQVDRALPNPAWPPPSWRFAGVGWAQSSDASPHPDIDSSLTIPHALFAGLFLIPPLLWLRSRRRLSPPHGFEVQPSSPSLAADKEEPRSSSGDENAFRGNNLRATSNKCPECGRKSTTHP